MIISLKAFKSFKRTISFENKMGYTALLFLCKIRMENTKWNKKCKNGNYN